MTLHLKAKQERVRERERQTERETDKHRERDREWGREGEASVTPPPLKKIYLPDIEFKFYFCPPLRGEIWQQRPLPIHTI